MSNYPPGVTGNEWQIRGMDEGVMYRECHEWADLHVMPDSELGVLNGLFASVRSLREKEEDKAARPKGSPYKMSDLDYARKHIITTLENLEKYLSEYDPKQLIYNTDDCTFAGDVDVQYGDRYVYWECPICGHAHEDEIDMTPDDPRI